MSRAGKLPQPSPTCPQHLLQPLPRRMGTSRSWLLPTPEELGVLFP